MKMAINEHLIAASKVSPPNFSRSTAIILPLRTRCRSHNGDAILSSLTSASPCLCCSRWLPCRLVFMAVVFQFVGSFSSCELSRGISGLARWSEDAGFSLGISWACGGGSCFSVISEHRLLLITTCCCFLFRPGGGVFGLLLVGLSLFG